MATPPEFKGGVEGVWSPEDLLVGSVASCFAVTLVAVAERRGVPLRGLDVAARGVVTQRPDGRFGFTEVVLEVSLSTEPGCEEEASAAARRRRTRLPRRRLRRLPRTPGAHGARDRHCGGDPMTAVHPSASFSATLRVRLDDRPGHLRRGSPRRSARPAAPRRDRPRPGRARHEDPRRDRARERRRAHGPDRGRRARGPTASRSSTSPTGRSCCISAGRSRSP